MPHPSQLVTELRRIADAIENGVHMVVSAEWDTEHEVLPAEDGGAPFKGPATFTAKIKFRGPI